MFTLSLALDLDGQGAATENIELYEKGYGKEAALIAKDAIGYAKTQKFDVVLVDTAGRMQDNEPLMRALARVCLSQPPFPFWLINTTITPARESQ